MEPAFLRRGTLGLLVAMGGMEEFLDCRTENQGQREAIDMVAEVQIFCKPPDPFPSWAYITKIGGIYPRRAIGLTLN